LRGAYVAAKDDLGNSLSGDIVEHLPQIAPVLLWLVIVAHFVPGERAAHDQSLPEMGVREVSNCSFRHCVLPFGVFGSRDGDRARSCRRSGLMLRHRFADMFR
jgi:hypothetical protein